MTDSTTKSPEDLTKELEELNKELEQMDAEFELLKKSSTPPNDLKKRRFDAERTFVTDEIKKVEKKIKSLENSATNSKKKIETKEQLLDHIASLHHILSKNIGSDSVADLYIAQAEGLETLANVIRDCKASIDKANPKPALEQISSDTPTPRGGPIPPPQPSTSRGPAKTIGSNSGGAMPRGEPPPFLSPPNLSGPRGRGPAKNLTKSPLPTTSVPNSGAMPRGGSLPPPPNLNGPRGPAKTIGSKAQPIADPVVNPKVTVIPDTKLIADPSAIRNQILKSLDNIRNNIEKGDFQTAQKLSNDLKMELKNEMPHISFLSTKQFMDYLNGKYFAPIKETLNEIEQYKVQNKWKELVDANLKLIELHKEATKGVAADLSAKPGSGTTKDFNQMDRMLISEKGIFSKENHPFYAFSDLITILTSKDADEVNKAAVKLTTIDENNFKSYFDHANTVLLHKMTEHEVLENIAKLKELKGKIKSASSPVDQKEISRLTDELTKKLQINLKGNKENPTFKKMLFAYQGSLLAAQLEKTAGVQPDAFVAAKAEVGRLFDNQNINLPKEVQSMVTWEVPQLIPNQEPINELTKLNELLSITKNSGRLKVLGSQKLQAEQAIASNVTIDSSIADIKKMFSEQFDLSSGETDAFTLLRHPLNWNAARTSINTQATRYFDAAKKLKANSTTGDASASVTTGKAAKITELPPEFLFLNDFEIEQIPFPGTDATPPATTKYSGLSGVLKYDFCLMSESVKNDPDSNAELGKFYISDDGSFIVRDPQSKAQRGNIPSDSGIDLSNLKNMLNDPDFKESILKISSKQGLTNDDPIKIEYEGPVDFFALNNEKGEEIKENLRFALISKGHVITQDDALFKELLNISSTPANNKFRNIFMMALATGYFEIEVDPSSSAGGLAPMTKTLTTDKVSATKNKNLRLITVNDANFDALFNMVKAASRQISVKDNLPEKDDEFKKSLKEGIEYLLKNPTLQAVPGDEKRKGNFIHPDALAHNQNVKNRTEEDKKKAAIKKPVKKTQSKLGGTQEGVEESGANTLDLEDASVVELEESIKASEDAIKEIERKIEKVSELRDSNLEQFNKEQGLELLKNGPTEIKRLKEQIEMEKVMLEIKKASTIIGKEVESSEAGKNALSTMNKQVTFLQESAKTKSAELEIEQAKSKRIEKIQALAKETKQKIDQGTNITTAITEMSQKVHHEDWPDVSKEFIAQISAPEKEGGFKLGNQLIAKRNLGNLAPKPQDSSNRPRF